MVFGGGSGINAVGPKIFIWPLLCCFIAAAYVYFLCPESEYLAQHIIILHLLTLSSATGKTLEEIDVLFARSPEVRERLERQMYARRRHSIDPGLGRRASTASMSHNRRPSAIKEDLVGGEKYSHDENSSKA